MPKGKSWSSDSPAIKYWRHFKAEDIQLVLRPSLFYLKPSILLVHFIVLYGVAFNKIYDFINYFLFT